MSSPSTTEPRDNVPLLDTQSQPPPAPKKSSASNSNSVDSRCTQPTKRDETEYAPLASSFSFPSRPLQVRKLAKSKSDEERTKRANWRDPAREPYEGPRHQTSLELFAERGIAKLPAKSLSHIAHLNGLRALAFAGVLLFHFRRGCQGGFLGVDIFFVLSGYLMTRSICFQLSRGSFSYTSFFLRRFWRLYPALMYIILLSMVFSYGFLPAEIAVDVAKSALASLFAVSNILYSSQEGYFGTSSALKPLLHTWSLSVEWQFYLLWPILLATLERLRNPKVFTVCFTFLSFASFAYGIQVGEKHPHAAFYMLPGRIFEFAVGALASTWKTVPFSSVTGNGLSATGTVLILSSFFYMTSSKGAPALIALPALAGTVMVIVSPSEVFVNKLYTSWIPDYIGKISYSAYLVHWPVFVFYHNVYEHTTAPPSVEIGVVCGLLAFSAWMYHNVEDEFRVLRTSRHRCSTLLLITAVAAMAWSGIVSHGWKRRSGFSSRPPRALPLLDYLNEYKHRFQPMKRKIPHSSQQLEYGYLPNKSRNAVHNTEFFDGIILGDSFGGPLAVLFSEISQTCNKTFIVSSQFSCAPFLDSVSMNGSVKDYASPATNPRGFTCKDSLRPSMLELVRGTNAEVVILAGNWLATSQMWNAGYKSVRAFGSKAKHLEVSQLEQTISRLRGMGRKILLLGMVPGAHYNVRACLAATGPLAFLKKCPSKSRFKKPFLGSQYQQRQMLNRVRIRKTFEALLEESTLLRSGVAERWLAYIDPYMDLCDETRGECIAINEGKPLYSDEYHLTGNGTLLLTKRVLEAISSLSLPAGNGAQRQYCPARSKP